MKRFSREVCLVALAVSVMIAGSFSIASADSYQRRYKRAYHHCAHQYRVGSHRFQRCMDHRLNGW